MKQYLVTLKPINSFFFGGETSFASGENESYIVHSRYFPQQTAMLGMLRMLVLDAHGKLEQPNNGALAENGAEGLIGKKSFNASSPDAEQAFGHIGRLSQVCLRNSKDEFIHKAPLDWDFAYTPATKLARMVSITADNTQNYLPLLDKYEPKKNDLKEGFLSNNGKFYQTSDIFIPYSKIGITKKSDRQEDEQGFYKQISLGFNKKKYPALVFAFTAELNTGTFSKIQSRIATNPIITMGGEKSAFHFQIEEYPGGIPFPGNHAYFMKGASSKTKIVLLCDAYMDNSVFNHCEYTVCRCVEFRHLKTSLSETRDYYKRGEGSDSNAIQRSDKYNLLERGSVMFIAGDENLNTITEKLKAIKAFSQIGYNVFQVIKSESIIQS